MVQLSGLHMVYVMVRQWCGKLRQWWKSSGTELFRKTCGAGLNWFCSAADSALLLLLYCWSLLPEDGVVLL